MNYKFLIILLLAVNFSYSSEKDQDQVLAAVGKHGITLGSFLERYNNYLSYSGVRDNLPVREAILNNMIHEIILLHYDDNENILNNEEYIKELAWTKKQTILAFLKDREIYAGISASEKEIRDAFVKINEKLSARHLYAETEEEADNLYELLKIGVDFDYLAAQVFSDTILKNNGGYLGYFTFDEMDPAFEEAAYSLKVGETSRPVKTAQGYSIIKLEDRISNPLLTENEYLEKRNQIARLIKIRKKRPAELQYLSGIMDFDKVHFNEESVSLVLSGIQLNFESPREQGEENKKYQAVCAEYNYEVYSVSDVHEWLAALPSSHKKRINTEENLKSLIKGFILQKKLLQRAAEKKYDENPEVLERFSKLEQNLFFKYKKELVTRDAGVSQENALDFYNRNIELFTSEKELNVQEILVEDSAAAGEIMKKLSAGEDFDRLAERYSLRKWSAEKGGELGWAPVSRYGMLKENLWKLQPGELTGPLNIKGYFGIFKILGKKESKPLKFDEVKEKVISLYKHEQQISIMKSHIENIQNNVHVQINDELLRTFTVAG